MAVGMLIFLASCQKLAPFGSNSLLFSDANIQYIEFFRWWRRVLLTGDTISYSFNKSLGGPMIAFWSYYLSSPLNLLVIFFKEHHLAVFFDYLVALKIVLATFSMAYYLNWRFKDLSLDWLSAAALAYAFSQYIFMQIYNVMWLDGVYLLPLLVMGVQLLLKDGKSHVLFLFCILSILFNWYTAYMNFLFLALFYLSELISHGNQLDLKQVSRKFLNFCRVIILALLSSMVLFLPVILALYQGKGQAEKNIFQWGTNNTLFEFCRGFILGIIRTEPNSALFCGIVIILGCFSYFLNQQINLKQRISNGELLLFLFASIYLKPLEHVWNGFREAQGHPIRFGYIVIFLMIYYAVLNIECKAKISKWVVLLYIVMLFGLNFHQALGIKKMGLSIAICLLILFGQRLKLQRRFNTLILLCLIAELVLNGNLILKHHLANNLPQFYDITLRKQYDVNQEQLVEDVQKYDQSAFYRVDQTWNRGMGTYGKITRGNEGLAFGYPSISAYSSTMDKNVNELIFSAGYSPLNTTIVGMNESMIAMESLLGVKYLFSEKNYPCYERVKEIELRNQKNVYQNPYALPLGLVVDPLSDEGIVENNPFEFQNQLFSQLLKRKVKLYTPVRYNDSYVNHQYRLTTIRQSKRSLLYGWGDFTFANAVLTIDGIYRINYPEWYYNRVFLIGNGEDKHSVLFDQVNILSEKDHLHLYSLDLDHFDGIINNLKTKGINPTEFQDGKVQFHLNAGHGKVLFTTIPYDKGWQVTINGKRVIPKKAIGSFIQIPLLEGDNQIELNYRIVGFVPGIILSFIGMSGYGYFYVWKMSIKNCVALNKN
ncbi:YfhO family protein [Vaginisenegalia massiliensis]|uniref:YfhO family protein n=1 Tax=Vaginisenegalia massiliensis TaxID=2058294 RepID=UPI000F5266E6|nr:YfhO family protein [Vaginisenegalia massiliensis]